MNSLRTYLKAWTLKYLPLLPQFRRQQQVEHLERCLKRCNFREPSV
ncbi:MAG: hypothetical protein ACFE0J_11535 [Elainellaceae cyanobacterium]